MAKVGWSKPKPKEAKVVLKMTKEEARLLASALVAFDVVNDQKAESILQEIFSELFWLSGTSHDVHAVNTDGAKAKFSAVLR